MGQEIALNGAADSTSARVIRMAYVNGLVYQEVCGGEMKRGRGRKES